MIKELGKAYDVDKVEDWKTGFDDENSSHASPYTTLLLSKLDMVRLSHSHGR